MISLNLKKSNKIRNLYARVMLFAITFISSFSIFITQALADAKEKDGYVKFNFGQFFSGINGFLMSVGDELTSLGVAAYICAVVFFLLRMFFSNTRKTEEMWDGIKKATICFVAVLCLQPVIIPTLNKLATSFGEKAV